MLPDTLIGRHAVLHIEWALEWQERRARYNESRSAGPGADTAEMERDLRRILETGLHAILNAGLRWLADREEVRLRGAPRPRRLLMGNHDIEAFSKQIACWPAARDLVATLAATGQVPEDPAGR
jgi:hypothetical protein